MRSNAGIALILAMLLTAFLTAIGLGLAMIVVTDQLASSHARGSLTSLYAADAALELTLRDLSHLRDLSDALSGAVRGHVVDGDATPLRPVPGGGAIDLIAATNHLNCNRSSACTGAQMDANTRDRPWGRNNARWRLFAYGPLSNFVQFAAPGWSYVAVWVADDGREEDGDPERDGAEEEAGSGVIRVRVEAFAPFGLRRAIEAELARLCIDDDDPCRERIRVQSWQEVRQIVP